MQLLAKLISILFGPFSFLPLVFVPLTVLNSGMLGEQVRIILPLLSITHFVYPAGVLGYFFSKGKISDASISKREEREPVYTLVVPGLWVGVLGSWWWGNQLLVGLITMLTVVFTVLAFFTYVEKVSAHMAVNTAAYFIANILFDWRYWWLFPLLLAIAWSRWQLKRHTVHQLVLGTLIPVVVFLTGMRFLL